MKIKFTPIRMDEQLTASVVDADKIILNGEELDFTPLLEGETIESSDVGNKWVSGTVSRTDGELYIILVVPHGHNAPYETRFPSPDYITVSVGAVPVPVHDVEPVEVTTDGN